MAAERAVTVEFKVASASVGHPDWQVLYWRRPGGSAFFWRFASHDMDVADAIGGPSGARAGAVEHPLGPELGEASPIMLTSWSRDCLLHGSGIGAAGAPWAPRRFGEIPDPARYVFALIGRGDREIFDGGGQPVPLVIDVSRLFPDEVSADTVRSALPRCRHVEVTSGPVGAFVGVRLQGDTARDFHRRSRGLPVLDVLTMAFELGSGLDCHAVVDAVRRTHRAAHADPRQFGLRGI